MERVGRRYIIFCVRLWRGERWRVIIEGFVYEGPRTRVVQPKMKCGKLSKYHKNDIKSGVYPSEKHEIFLIYYINIPLVLKHKISQFKGGVN